MAELTREELLSLKEGTVVYAAYPCKVYKCELYLARKLGSIWGNSPDGLVVELSGIGPLYEEECSDLYLDKNEALVRAKAWERENRKAEVLRWEVEYNKALAKLNTAIEVDYE